MIDDFKSDSLRKRDNAEKPAPKIRYGDDASSDTEPVATVPPAPETQPDAEEIPASLPESELTVQEDDDELAQLDAPAAEPATPKKKRFQWKLRKPSKKELLIGIPVIALLLGAGTTAIWIQTHKAPPAIAKGPKTHVIQKPAPVVITSTLTGLPVADKSVNERPVTGVMIENSPDARPQSGLDQAGVVFEAIAEGGITRFHVLFQDSQPDYIGPVRSARPYYVQWCMGFDCSLAHVGGSPEALSDIKSWGVKDLDQFANGGAYQRISSRYAPHNVYTSLAQLNQLEADKGFGASKYTGFPRKKDNPYKAPAAASTTSSTTKKSTQPQDTRTAATAVDMNISGTYYNTHYDYDAATNSYKRNEGGAAHMSLHKDGSQVQIQPKVVIAMVMQYGLEADDHHSQYNVIGSGQAFVFQDGTVTTGTWAKVDAASQITFADQNGKPIALDAGQTWLTALSGANQVVFK